MSGTRACLRQRAIDGGLEDHHTPPDTHGGSPHPRSWPTAIAVLSLPFLFQGGCVLAPLRSFAVAKGSRNLVAQSTEKLRETSAKPRAQTAKGTHSYGEVVVQTVAGVKR